jgi:hypothetical protein
MSTPAIGGAGKQLTERFRMKQQSTDGSLIGPAADAVASEEPEALSRFVGEGGPEAPLPVTELIEIPLTNGIWRRLRPGGTLNEPKENKPKDKEIFN